MKRVKECGLLFFTMVGPILVLSLIIYVSVVPSNSLLRVSHIYTLLFDEERGHLVDLSNVRSDKEEGPIVI